jgi:hypothetical protein
MIISGLAAENFERWVELSARVRPDRGRSVRIWFRFSAEVGMIPPLGDPFLAGLLVPCMWSGEELRIEGPVSRRLLESVPRIQELLGGWYPELGRITVTASEVTGAADSGPRPSTGAFFSGGVDSVYTLVKHRSSVDRLILVHGFENPVDDHRRLEVTRQAILPTVEMLDTRLLIAHTNLRRRADPMTTVSGREYPRSFFGFLYQGSILAAVGLCLQQNLGRILVPASFTHRTMQPYGSHPSLDPLWSTERTEFVHDGCEASRLEKVERIVREVPRAARSLQVCETAFGGEVNCCACEKCLRTMLALRLCGVLDQAVTFPRSLSLRAVRRLPFPLMRRQEYAELLEVSERSGDTDVAEAVAHVLSKRPGRVGPLPRVRRVLSRGPGSLWPRLRHALRTGRLRRW